MFAWLHNDFIELKSHLCVGSYFYEKVHLKKCKLFALLKYVWVIVETFHPDIINTLSKIQDPLF